MAFRTQEISRPVPVFPLIPTPLSLSDRSRPSCASLRSPRFFFAWRSVLAALLLALLAACASTKVEPGHYRVQSGDTLIQIARDNNTSVSNLMRWNNLSSANHIDVGQILRVQAPPGSAPAASSPGSSSGSSAASSARHPRHKAAAQPAPEHAAGPITIRLIWPADGKITRRYGNAGSHGVTIGNAAGTPVIAAAAGTVAYASNGLRGYGNLIIIKHASNYLTIYAHNRKLLVKQGQTVTQGQKIAEMGNTDSKVVELYFELRSGGTAVDPTRALPSR
jgi:murein DD-endopeptidase MepM/ murein hydrolase activator NlpD